MDTKKITDSYQLSIEYQITTGKKSFN